MKTRRDRHPCRPSLSLLLAAVLSYLSSAAAASIIEDSPCSPSQLTLCNLDALRASATAVFESNAAQTAALGRFTLPWAGAYPHIRAVDGALTVMGAAQFDVAAAGAELRALLAGQWANGFIPHAAFDPSVRASPLFPPGDFLPGPGFWRTAPAPWTEH